MYHKAGDACQRAGFCTVWRISEKTGGAGEFPGEETGG